MAKLPDGDATGALMFKVLVGCEAWGSLPGLATGPKVGDTVGVRTGDAGVTAGTPLTTGGAGETGAGEP